MRNVMSMLAYCLPSNTSGFLSAVLLPNSGLSLPMAGLDRVTWANTVVKEGILWAVPIFSQFSTEVFSLLPSLMGLKAAELSVMARISK